MNFTDMINSFRNALIRMGNNFKLNKTPVYKNDIRLVEFNDTTLKYYRENTRGNENISKSEANKKISRNLALALKYKSNNYQEWYSYGQLRFLVEGEEVVWIKNHCAKFPMWYKDWDKYYELSRQLGISENHTRKN